MPPPLVSIIIPNYNRTLTLQRAVRSALAQTFQDLEIIVVDDCSPTDPAPFLKELKDDRVRLIRHEQNRHAAAARNTGAEAAKGEFIAFLDSDDEWLPNHLAQRVQHMNQHPQCQGSYGALQIYRDGKKAEAPLVRRPFNDENMLDYLLSGRGKAQTSTLFFRKKAFLEVRFDPSLFQHQDYDLVIRFEQKYKDKFCCLPNRTTILHLSSTLPSITKSTHHSSCLKVMQESSYNVSFKNLYNYCLEMAYNALSKPENKQFAHEYLKLLIDNQSPKTIINQWRILIWRIFDSAGLKFLYKSRPYSIRLKYKIRHILNSFAFNQKGQN